MEIGKRLKEARKEKNISLDHLQEETKIQKRYLIAIEEGNFHILPGTFYARAFIKEYASAVGLDPEELLAIHENELPSLKEKNTMQYTRLRRSRRRRRSSRSPVILRILPTIIVILLIVGILFVGWTLYQQSIEGPSDANSSANQQDSNEFIRNENDQINADDPLENHNEEENDQPTDDETNHNESEESVMELILKDTQPGTKPESTFDLINPTDEELTITFEPTGESWIDIENEDRVRIEGQLTQAESPLEFSIDDQEVLRINIGFAPAVPVIKINDLTIEYPFDPNEYNTQRFWIYIKSSEEES